MTQATRTGVNQHGDLATLETERSGHQRIYHLGHLLDLHEVIPASDRAELSGPTVFRPP